MNARPLEFDIRGNNKSRAAFRQVQKDVTSLRKTFAAGLGVGILSAELIQLPTLMRGVISEASNMAKVADKVGMPIEELQRLQFGFELAGVDIRATNMALQRFSRRVGEAANGSGELYKIFEANGVALRNQDGSLRKQTDILRDYADLIKNAGSEQEKLYLAFKAFDREGAALVNALRNGSLGLTRITGAAKEAGGVLEEELSRRAEEIDDKFAKLWRTFELSGKRAVLSVAEVMDDFFSGPAGDPTLKDLQKSLTGERRTLARELSFLEGYGTQAEIDAMRERLESLDARLAGIMRERAADGFGTLGPSRRGGRRGKLPETIIPDRTKDKSTGTGASGGAGRGSGARQVQIAQYERILNQLQSEADLLGLSALEQRKVNALKMAGVDATSAQGQAIAALVEQIHGQTAAQNQLNEITGYLGGIASNQIGTFIQELGFADNAAGRLASTLAEAALQAALLGQGPLSGMFGGGGFLPKLLQGFGAGFGGFGGGAGGILANAFAGMYADGGTLGSGQWGIAGEVGPEIITGPAKVISNADSFGKDSGPKTVVYMTVNARDAESFKRSETQIAGRITDLVNRGQRGR